MCPLTPILAFRLGPWQRVFARISDLAHANLIESSSLCRKPLDSTLDKSSAPHCLSIEWGSNVILEQWPSHPLDRPLALCPIT